MSSIARQLNGLHFVFILLGQITTLEMVQITACISNKLQQIQNKKWNRMMNREKRKESGEWRKNRKRKFSTLKRCHTTGCCNRSRSHFDGLKIWQGRRITLETLLLSPRIKPTKSLSKCCICSISSTISIRERRGKVVRCENCSTNWRNLKIIIEMQRLKVRTVDLWQTAYKLSYNNNKQPHYIIIKIA